MTPQSSPDPDPDIQSSPVGGGEQRWRYAKGDGRPVWLPFDPTFPCLYCDEAVGSLSFGGPAVCPRCDCGRGANGEWTIREAMVITRHARERLDALADDPIWQAYEIAITKATPQSPGVDEGTEL